MMRRTIFAWTPVLAVALMLAVAVTGCNESSTPVAGGGGGGALVVSSVTVSASNTNIGTPVVVEATVETTGGSPMAGEWVTFVATPANLGSFTSDSAQTDANGIASTIFNPSAAGALVISAEIDNGSKLTRPLTVATPGGGGGDPGSGLVSVAVSPTLMKADGTTSATVTITAFTPSSQPVPDSTAIKLAAGEWFIDMDGNGYFTPAVDTLKIDYNANQLWDAIGLIPSVVYTSGGAGVAVATYTAGNVAGTVYLKATVGDPGSSYYGAATLSLTPNDSIANIELFVSQADIQVHGTGGDDFTEVTATCYDAFGNRAPEGLPVSLVVVSGPGGGEGIDGIVGQPVSKLTDASGEATWTVASGTISGTVRLRAAAGTVLSTAVQIVVNAGPPFEISLGTASCNVQAWNWVNRVNDVVAVVVDAYGNPVPAGTAVYFTTEEGMVTAYDITEEDGGVATASWHSGDPQNDGIVWIWAETSGGTVKDSTAFISSSLPASVAYLLAPTSLPANPGAKAEVIVEVLDVNNNFVVWVTPVDFFTDFGSIAGGITDDGCSHSTVETEFFSEAPDQDYSPVSPDDGIAAVATVVARAGLATATTTINLLSGTAYFKNCTIEFFGEMTYGATVPVEVVIKDRQSVPLGGHSVVLTATSGSVVGSPAITDSYGTASFLYTAPADSTVALSAMLTATDNDPRGGLTVAQKVTFSTVRINAGGDPRRPTLATFSDK